VLTNRKPDHRRGKVQLIDATQWFKPLRKNLGKKNCELAPDDIQRICDAYLAFKETPQSKIFPKAAFGYWKVTVERPLRLHSQLSVKAIESLRFASAMEELRSVLYDGFGDKLVDDFAGIAAALEKRLAEWGSDDDEEESEDGATTKKGLPEKKKKKLLDATSWRTTPSSSKRPTLCGRNSAATCLKITMSSVTAWTRTGKVENQTLRVRPQDHPPCRELARRKPPRPSSPRPTSRPRPSQTRCAGCMKPR